MNEVQNILNKGENINPKDPEKMSRLKDYVQNDKGQAMGNEELFRQIQELISKEGDTSFLANYTVEDIRALLENGYASINFMVAKNEGVRAKYEIYLGRTCNILRVMVKSKKMNWNEYVKDTIKIPSTTLQRYMRIAEIRDAEKFAYLGIERLFFVVSSMKSIEFGGDLKKFVDTFNVTFDPEEEQSMAEFKAMVRKAIFEKLSSDNEWNLEPEQIERLGKKSDIDLSEFYECAMIIKNVHGNVATYAESVLTDTEKSGDFIDDLNKAIKATSELSLTALSGSSLFSRLNVSEITKLENFLKQLQEKASVA